MQLFLVRHGETIENKESIIQGHMPGKLSLKGIKQTEQIAERLKIENFDYIYSSDLARAADTAKTIAKFHPNSNMIFTKNLREQNLGELQGKQRNIVKQYGNRMCFSYNF